jgi:predicted phosphodiesterase
MARIAVISDIHANLTALDAVIADIRRVGVDLVIQGGDLVSGGPRPAEVIDRVRDMGWPGVYGNTDEMLWRPQRVSEILQAPSLYGIRDLLLTQTIPSIVELIGADRLAWLRTLPRRWSDGGLSVVHAGPDDVWHNIPATTSDDELTRVYGPLASTFVVYGHIHQPYIRRLTTFTVANAGAVGLPYDGDPRASYLLIDGDRIEMRRVDYDIERETSLLQRSSDPFAAATVQSLRTGRYVPVR